jgi:hypothetical protein
MVSDRCMEFEKTDSMHSSEKTAVRKVCTTPSPIRWVAGNPQISVAVGDHESFKRFAECRAYGRHLWRAQRHVPALVLCAEGRFEPHWLLPHGIESKTAQTVTNGVRHAPAYSVCVRENVSAHSAR